jgi:outer membrane protein TolC
LERAAALAREQNQSLRSGRLGIIKRQAEARYYARSWIPTIRINTGLSLSGSRYPLTRSSWTVGLTLNFASPWLNGSVSGGAGWDPPFDRSMRLGTTLSPLEEPAQVFSGRSAELALIFEKEAYERNYEKIERSVASALEKCRISERRRDLSLELNELAASRVELSLLKLSLGQIRRVDLMEDQLDLAEAEIHAVEAAASLLEAERELEELLNLPPGGLKDFSTRSAPYARRLLYAEGG